MSCIWLRPIASHLFTALAMCVCVCVCLVFIYLYWHDGVRKLLNRVYVKFDLFYEVNVMNWIGMNWLVWQEASLLHNASEYSVVIGFSSGISRRRDLFFNIFIHSLCFLSCAFCLRSSLYVSIGVHLVSVEPLYVVCVLHLPFSNAFKCIWIYVARQRCTSASNNVTKWARRYLTIFLFHWTLTNAILYWTSNSTRQCLMHAVNSPSIRFHLYISLYANFSLIFPSVIFGAQTSLSFECITG